MDDARDELAALGCSVLIVAQAKPEVISLYLSHQSWHVPIVSDAERIAYGAFGLERTGWLTFFKPSVLWKYFRGMMSGHGVRKPYAGEDVLQLGGDFLLDKLGRVVFAYPSANPTDRPTLATICAALSRLSPSGLNTTSRDP